MYILRYNFSKKENKEYLLEKEFETLKDLELYLNVAEIIKNYEIVKSSKEVKKEVKKERFRIEIRVTEEKKKAITEFAKENNTTVSKILNDLIDLVLEGNLND